MARILAFVLGMLFWGGRALHGICPPVTLVINFMNPCRSEGHGFEHFHVVGIPPPFFDRELNGEFGILSGYRFSQVSFVFSFFLAEDGFKLLNRVLGEVEFHSEAQFLNLVVERIEAARATRGMQSEVESPRYIPPLEDFWKVYDSLPVGQDQMMLFTYLHTAARRGELFALKWHEVDFAKKRLKLWTRKRRGGNLEFDWVPITEELFEKLKWWYENRTFPEAQNVFVCESQVPCQRDLRGRPFMFRQEWMQEICARAGVKHFGIHAIRHLSASSLDDAGYPITIIQGILRHKNANTTAKYLHKLKGMRVALDDAFRRPQPKVAMTANETGRSTPAKVSDRPVLRVLSAGKAPQRMLRT